MAKRTRKRYSDKQRAKILAAASAEGLTAKDVQKRFGVRPITYYSWRKVAGRGSRQRKRNSGSALEDNLREQIRSQIQRLIPAIIKSEVDAQLAGVFGSVTKKRGRRRLSNSAPALG